MALVTFNSLYQYLCFDVIWCSVSLKKGFGTFFFYVIKYKVNDDFFFFFTTFKTTALFKNTNKYMSSLNSLANNK